jgi:hypothetical protein
MENQIGKNIEWGLRTIRQTQAWLAKQLGVSEKVVARWISNGQISVDHAAKVAALLKIPLEELLGIEDASRPNQVAHLLSLKRHVICVDDNELHTILSLRRAPDDVRALAVLNLHRALKAGCKKP